MRSNFHEFQFAKRNIAVERQNKLEMASNAVCAAVAHFAADYISSVLNSDGLGIHITNWVVRYLTDFRKIIKYGKNLLKLNWVFPNPKF